jgi:hypothetical protein
MHSATSPDRAALGSLRRTLKTNTGATISTRLSAEVRPSSGSWLRLKPLLPPKRVDRTRRPQIERAQGSSFRHLELRRHSHRPSRKRVVRRRERSLHRSLSAKVSAGLKWRIGGLCFWMRWATFRWICSPNCCGRCRRRRLRGWAALGPSPLTSGWSRPLIAI